jgi:type VI secretion system secreted protein VgrG
MQKLAANEPRFSFKAAGSQMHVIRFVAQEHISRPFRVDLELAAEKEIKSDDIIGQTALLTIESADADRLFHGIIWQFGHTGVIGRFYLYRACMVPALWLLSFEQDCRIFQQKTVKEVVQQVLEDAGITSDNFEFRLQGSYGQRDYCVQYRESDLNFVSRLLEDEGIFYFFEHKNDRHLLVFGDGTVNYQPVAGDSQIVFNPGGQMVAEQEAVTQFERMRQIHTGQYALTDYLFKKPDMNLSASVKDKEYDKLEVYDYPGGYATSDAGRARAQVRLQQAAMYADRIDGQSVVARLVPGFTFKLSGHDTGAFNQEYALTAVTHQGEQPQVLAEYAADGSGTSYANQFTAVPASVTIRPEPGTPRPVVQGVQTAIVTGPAGEEVYPDQYGRVKVQFHWDRLGKRDEHSSCWIRVSQAWAGAGWGAVFLPRLGQEVIVSFIEGDPDHPIITGRVYHGTNTPPYELPGEKTKSTLKSNSSLGGGGSNEIRFEDKKGGEEIYLHGQKDWTIAIENDKTQTVGHDESLSVGNNRDKTVGANQTASIGSNMSTTVGQNNTETVAVAKMVTVGAAYQITVGAAMNETVGAAKFEEIGAAKSVSVGANSSETVAKDKSIDVGQNVTANIGKDTKVQTGKKMLVSTGDDFGLTIDKKGAITIKDQFTIKCGSASLTLKKNGDVLIKGSKISVKASGDVSIKGSNIKEN